MAGSPSGDPPANRTNGTVGRQQERTTAAAHALKDEQTLADSDQTLADSDQTSADDDQTGSDSDQTSFEIDQRAADRDQAASDRDLAHGVDPVAHETSREIRAHTTLEREQTTVARLQVAGERDAGADARDLAALVRDKAADARDLAMTQREAVYEPAHPQTKNGAGVAMPGSEQRTRAATHRSQAGEDRASAAQDRRVARHDREQGAHERRAALADREALAARLAIAETDELTGVRTRSAGLTDLEHELDRCRRSNAQLVVSYVDVIGLKALNDSKGHAAGDELLKRVIGLIRSHVRSYDLIVRMGGDEFVCAMSSMSADDARQRFGQIADALAVSPNTGAIRTGFAELAPDESATELIARADAQLLDAHSS